jgi:hypothetical protein
VSRELSRSTDRRGEARRPFDHGARNPEHMILIQSIWPSRSQK